MNSLSVAFEAVPNTQLSAYPRRAPRLLRNLSNWLRETPTLCVHGVSASAFFLGPIEHSQVSDLLSVPNQSNENAEDAEVTQRLGDSLGSLLKFLRSRRGPESRVVLSERFQIRTYPMMKDLCLSDR